MREPWERIGGILEGVVEQALEHEGIQSLHISYSATVTSGWAHLTAFYVDRKNKNKREGDAFRVSACVCVYIQAFSFKQSTTQLYTNYIGWRKTLLVVPLWLIWFLFFWLSSFVLTVVPKRKSVPNTPPFFSLRISLKSNLIYMQMSRLVECKWRLMDASHLAPNAREESVGKWPFSYSNFQFLFFKIEFIDWTKEIIRFKECNDRWRGGLISPIAQLVCNTLVPSNKRAEGRERKQKQQHEREGLNNDPLQSH